MESGPLSTQEFKEFAEDVVLFCHVTARIPGRKHDGLLTEKGGRGFPHLVYMDADGEVIGQPTGRSVAAFREGAERAGAYCALVAKTDRTPAEQAELLGLQVEFGKVTSAEARAQIAAMGELDAETQAKVDATLALLDAMEFDAQVQEIMQSKGRPQSEEAYKKLLADVGPQFWAFYQEGKRTSSDPMATQTYYNVLLAYGLELKQPGAARAGYEGLNAAFGDNPRARKKLAEVLKQVEALEGE